MNRERITSSNCTPCRSYCKRARSSARFESLSTDTRWPNDSASDAGSRPIASHAARTRSRWPSYSCSDTKIAFQPSACSAATAGKLVPVQLAADGDQVVVEPALGEAEALGGLP